MRIPQAIDDLAGPSKISGTQINFRECPICGSQAWKFYVNPDTGAWCCFAGDCRGHGKMRVHCSPDALIRKLAGKAHGKVEWHEIGLPEWKKLEEPAFDFMVVKYALDIDMIRRYLLVEGTGELAYRILVPFTNRQGELIYWTGRKYSGDGPKYYTMGGKHPLYVPSWVAGDTESPDTLVLVEGVFDAIKVHACTGLAAAAVGGKALPKYLLPYVLEMCRKHIVVCMDSDALAATLSMSAQLEPYAEKLTRVTLPEGEDPGSMFPHELKERFTL